MGAVQKSVAEILATGDVSALLAFHRATFGDTTMTQPDPTPPTPAPPADPPTPRTFTQDELNAILARERTSAQQAATQQLANDLGVSLDEAKQIVAQRKSDDDAKRTEAERAAAAWKTAQEGAEAIKAAAEQERHEAKLERALSRAGLDVDNETMRRAGLAALDVPANADAAAVTAAVEQLKTDAPALFGSASTTVTPPSSTPPHAPRPPAPQNTMAAAREKARGQVVSLGFGDSKTA